jgi:pyridoxamine 5'-phosphate oxidase
MDTVTHAREAEPMSTGSSIPRFTAPIAAPIESLPQTLPALLDDVWRRIAAGLNGRWPPWGLPTLATLSPQRPRARVLALRSVDPVERLFVFHTDVRSDKVREVTADSRVSLVFWDPGDAIEARFTGSASVHCRDQVAREAWQQVSPLRRMASEIEYAPGAVLSAPSRFDTLPTTTDDEVGLSHFAVVRVHATALDWFWLGPGDMRRAFIRWTDSSFSAAWVVP